MIFPVQDINEAELRLRLGWMKNWLESQVNAEGKMRYSYDPFVKKQKPGNNMVRQWMATLALFRLAEFYQDGNLSALAEKNLSYNTSQYLVLDEEKKIAYVYSEKKAKLGAAAFALSSFLHSKTHPEREKYIKYLYQFILELQQPDGSFRTFYLPASRNDNQNFYPGEAMLALMTLFESNPSHYREIPVRVRKAFDYYRGFFRTQPNPAFVPWHTMALARLYHTQGSPKEELADFIFELNDFVISIQNNPGRPNDPEPKTFGRFYDPERPEYGPPHASSTAVFTEGLVDALDLAIEKKDSDRQKKYASAILWGFRSLFQLQYTPETSARFKKPGRVMGGIRTNETKTSIRMDNTQHATMALLNLLDSPIALELVLKTKK